MGIYAGFFIDTVISISCSFITSNVPHSGHHFIVFLHSDPSMDLSATSITSSSNSVPHVHVSNSIVPSFSNFGSSPIGYFDHCILC